MARRICPLESCTDTNFPQAFVVACLVQGIQLNVGAQIIFEWKMFYSGNKYAFFLVVLSLPFASGQSVFARYRYGTSNGSPIHPFLVRPGSISSSKRRRKDKVISNRAATISDEEDPLSGAWVKRI